MCFVVYCWNKVLTQANYLEVEKAVLIFLADTEAPAVSRKQH